MSRAALLKRNPLTRTVRSMLAENAINPDRVDLDSVQAMAMGEKSVQVRAEVMVTVPLDVFLQGLEEAREQIDQEETAAAAEAEAQRIADQGQTADAEPDSEMSEEEMRRFEAESAEEGIIDGTIPDDDGF